MTRFKPDIWDQTAVLLTVGMAALGVYVARYGAEGAIPMHFDIHGKADRWGDRTEAGWVLAGMGILTLATHAAITFAAARRELDPAASKIVAGVRLMNLLIMAVLAAVILALGLGKIEDGHDPTPVIRLILGVSWLAIALSGGRLGKISPNRLVGVRVYWTFKSRLAWDRSNRLVGRLFFWGSLLGLATLPFLSAVGMVVTMLAVVLSATVLGLFEAWRAWKSDPERLP